MTCMRLTRRTLLAQAAATGVLAAPAIVRADEPIRLRCTLDTAAAHGRNVAVRDYLDKVEASAGGIIKVELFEDGSLVNDLDAGNALVQGQVEMALPGTWTLTSLVSDADMFQLPALYGQPVEVLHEVIDGPSGAALGRVLHDRLRVVLLGPWLDLGYMNWYTSGRIIRSLADLRGLRIRNSGGAGQAWRARFVGAAPVTTPWPDVPQALAQKSFDGLVTTTESLVSARLWEGGVRYGYEDHQFFGVYLPLVSAAFWDQLSPSLQTMMTSLWLENIMEYRRSMGERQDEARRVAAAQGISFLTPADSETVTTRQTMLTQQDKMATEIKVSPELVRMVSADAGVTG